MGNRKRIFEKDDALNISNNLNNIKYIEDIMDSAA